MPSLAEQQYRMIHTIYVMLDDGDRRLLRQYDLSTSQYATLLVLDADQGLRLTDLGDYLLLDKSTITRMIDRLEGADLVRRVADPSDRRVLRVVLTPQGIKLRQAASEAHGRSLNRRMCSLTTDERQALHALLDKLRIGLRADLKLGIEH
jgi:DNA-binding MarR family transcriptional regulator